MDCRVLCKKFYKALFFIFMLFFTIFTLNAEDEIVTSDNNTDEFVNGENSGDSNESVEVIDSSQYEFKYNEDNAPEFIQKIYWEKSEYAVKYKFLLKDLNDRIIIEKDTELDAIEFSLPAGEYFYRLITYNVLGQAEKDTDWIKVVIKKAYLPVINNVSPQTVYIEEYLGDPVVITGADFTDEITVILKDLRDKYRKVVKGKITEQDDKRLVVEFDVKEFINGSYDLILTNPGSVYATHPFSVKYKKPVDIFLTTGYAPLINTHSGDFNPNLTDIFIPGGVRFDAAFFPLKFSFGFFGAGISADFTYFEENKAISMYGFFLRFSHTINYIYYFHRIVGIMPRIGAGISLTGLKFDYGIEHLNKHLVTIDPFFTFGVGVQVRPFRGISIYGGLDYVQIFFGDSSGGFLQPSLSVGYYF